MTANVPTIHESASNTRQPTRLIKLVRWLVLGLIIFSIGTLLVSIVHFPAAVPGAIASLVPNNNWTVEMTQAALDQLGWSPQPLVWFFGVLGWITAFVYCAVGLIVFRRKSDSWFGLYVAVTFAVLLTSNGASPLVSAHGGGLLTGWYALTGALGWQFLFIQFYLFPDGRFIPSWTRWLLLGWLLGYFVSLFAPSLMVFLIPWGTILMISAVASQIYRYTRVSDTLQRQQTKWIAFMVGAFLLFVIPGILTFSGFAPTGPNLATNFLFFILMTTLIDLWLLCLPIVIGIAILRYRLWDIDIIIRRTLVYLPLTAILAGVFAASIKILQTLFSPLFGQQSGAATTLTTLIVVAAFDPIKGWLQKFVDTRFKDTSNPQGRWKAYDEQVQAFVQMNDAKASAQRLLVEALAVFDVKDGAIYLQSGGEMLLIQALGKVLNTPEISIPLEHQGDQVGRLTLGARRSGRPYSLRDREQLLRTASAVAAVIAMVEPKYAHDLGK